MDPWLLGVAWNTLIALAYLGIALALVRRLGSLKAAARNPLGAATFGIFLGCGLGHLVIVLQLLALSPTAAAATVHATRHTYLEGHMLVIDGATAIVGVWYWSMRAHFRGLIRGASLFEDVEVRRRRALHIHDTVLQGIVEAKLALEMARREQASGAVTRSLHDARHIINALLADTSLIVPGSLRRRAPDAPATDGPHRTRRMGRPGSPDAVEREVP